LNNFEVSAKTGDGWIDLTLSAISHKTIKIYIKTKSLFYMVINICSVGGSFDVDMAEGPEGYVCTECGTQYKGIGKNPKCPKCSSDKVVKIG